MPRGTHGPAAAHGATADAGMAGHSLPLSAALCRVTLTPAPCREHPDGGAGRGDEIVAPLRPDGRRDAALWHEARAAPPG